MNDFDQVLDDSLEQIANGSATPDECLAQHPEYSAQLEPFLHTATHLEQGRGLAPSEAYKSNARDQLMAHMQAHPRRNKRNLSRGWSIAISLAVLVVAFFITGTAFAQGALPGQPLYDWKLSSEQLWRVSSYDQVSVDLAIADRRTFELTSLTSNSAYESRALAGYKEVLFRLDSEVNTLNKDRISYSLKSNQLKLSAAGIKIPELDKRLSH
jgi:hypothetical protein